ncbi:MAG: ABC transporter substrate-binding protein [Burkholderiaceae bacterium]|jgi:branched-chain amino acid transport system substrate-binding protein
MVLQKSSFLAALAIACGLLVTSTSALAQIKVGITLSATGPAASLGGPQRNTATLLPKEIAGKTIEYIILDDASDTTTAVKNTRKLITEDNVDVVIGSSVTPNSIAMIDVVSELQTPMISLAASAKIIDPVDAKRMWVFKTPQNDSLMAAAVAEHMAKSGIKTVGYIGFSDAYGQGWNDEFSKAAQSRDLKIVANESYARTDTSVTGQVLRLIAANPDAILIGASGTPAALPEATLRERGYKGKIYQTHGVANNDFLRVGGKDVEGTILPAGPILVAAQLPDGDPTKAQGLAYTRAYEAAFGAGSVATFGAHLWDAALILEHAIPEALKTAQPGTPAFRRALRDAIESTHNLAISHGVVNMSKTDHSGLDARARVMVTVKDGKWLLLK